MQRLKQILHSLAGGKSQKAICAEVHCSKRVVSGYKKMADDTHKSYDELLAMPDSELKTIFMPDKVPATTDGRKDELDRMMPRLSSV